VSTLKESRKKESALFARVCAGIASSFASFKAFRSRIKAAGRQKLTIMLIPHTEKKVINIQLSFFGVGAILACIGLVFLAFVFSAARFSDTANKLQSRSSDLASTQANLEAIRDQTKGLLVASRRFESALSGSLDDTGSKAAAASPGATDGGAANSAPAAASGASVGATGDAARELEELQKVTDNLEQSVDPLNSLGSLLKSQSSVLSEVPNIWPVRGASHISMYYGQNENPFNGQWYINKGVDISTYRSGDPVLATADGTVSVIGFDESMGNYIVIQHNHGFFTRYGHLMAFRVEKGQKVQQGQIIALLGNTGLTSGPYLHYEVHVGTGVIDPVKFLNLRAAVAAAE
jgi:murein DD-endopeptidase MepM/ murein hydrolase activator NlpD